MSTLLNFYRLKSPDSQGRMLWELWAFDDRQMEMRHDFIQWMFPLNEPSAFNSQAPLVTAEDQRAFKTDPAIMQAYRKSIDRFLGFIGLEFTDDGSVIKAADFAQRRAIWEASNHNWLRITRFLKSMKLLGFDEQAAALWECLRRLHEDDGFVSDSSFAYWKEAATQA